MTTFLKEALNGVVIVLVLSAVFTFFGVYNTGEMPIPFRFLFWLTTIGVGAVASAFTVRWIMRGPAKSLSGLAQFVLVAVIVSVPVTIVIQAYVIVLSGRAQPLWQWGLQFGYVLVVSFVITGITVLLNRAGIISMPGTALGAPVRTSNAAAEFLDRLPIKYRGAVLYAVSSEDHYLRVHTDRGEEMILMRLADAIRELNGAAGLQTHRSWWVAAEGVADARRDGGKQLLILKSGTEAPVSRSYSKAVRAAGLS